ncbi:MAG: 4-hydroxy-tetrahydrodipicolinate reductase [Alphaproteobacteria bacterium]
MRIAVVGATGRMGQMLVRQVLKTESVHLSGVTEHAKSESLGKDIGRILGQDDLGIEVTAKPEIGFDKSDVVIDFTIPEASLEHARIASEVGAAMVIGTTGFTDQQLKQMNEYAKHIPIVLSYNMSVGVNLMKAVTEMAASKLGLEYDVEIIEMHHKRKIDAPSGTAVELGEIVANARGQKLEDVQVPPRWGRTGAREEGTIGFSVLRGGEVIGDHTVMFASPQERIEITHKSSDREIYAAGAVYAAEWLSHQQPGLYSMRDVLGL